MGEGSRRGRADVIRGSTARFSARYALAFGAVLGLWFLGTAWLAPRVIADMYHGRSLPILNRIIEGASEHPLQEYLDSWSALSGSFTAWLIVAGILLYGILLFRLPSRARELAREIGGRAASSDPIARRLTTHDVGWLVVWSGLLTATVELLQISRHVLLGRWIPPVFGVHERYAWLTPVAYLMVFSLVGALVLSVRRLKPEWMELRGACFLFGLGILWMVFRAWPVGMHDAAAALLAAGIAWNTSRLAPAYPEGARLTIRRTTAWLAVILVAVSVALPLSSTLSERRALAGLPMPRTGAPNVLLVILDTVRAQSLGLHGYDRPTSPNLDAWAERGVLFERAIATSPWTLPSHATLFTGRYPNELSADWQAPLDRTHATLAEVLSARGFVTAGFVANLIYCTRASGLARGFLHYDDAHLTPWSLLNAADLSRGLATWARTRAGNRQTMIRKTAEDVNGAFLNWLSRLDGRRPFFAFLNYFDAHDPYLPPTPFDRRFTPETGLYWLDDRGEYSTEELTALRDSYDNSLAYLDEQLGRLFAELERRGVLANTLVIVTSDHGEEFGEHAAVGHGKSLYATLLHVPMLVSYPGHVPEGVRVAEPVSLRDLPATVLDLAGPSDGPGLPGTSLAHRWDPAGGLDTDIGDSSPAVAELTGRSFRGAATLHISAEDKQSIVEGSLQYILSEQGREELYDLSSDPWEQVDLIPTEPGRSAAAALRARLLAAVGRTP